MSLPDVVARVAHLQSLAVEAVTPPEQRQAARVAAPVPSVGTSSFASVLTRAIADPTTFGSASGAGGRTLAAAQAEVGVAEEPPGSNDGARIADYRAAVRGAIPGAPWCAYFVSWAAARAGTPLGDAGEGFGSVAALTEWAGRTGKLLPAGSQPEPGDLVLFGDRHVGIVESVAADGTLTTVEGNYGQGVQRTTRAPGEPTGFVRLG